MPAPSFQCFGSGPFYEQAKMLRKTLIFTDVVTLDDLLSLKTAVPVPTLYLLKKEQDLDPDP